MDTNSFLPSRCLDHPAGSPLGGSLCAPLALFAVVSPKGFAEHPESFRVPARVVVLDSDVAE